VNFIMVLGDDFETYEADAIWKDTIFGFKHFSDFEKVGVVTDRTWIAESMRLFSPLIPAETKAFPVAQKDEALRWVTH